MKRGRSDSETARNRFQSQSRKKVVQLIVNKVFLLGTISLALAAQVGAQPIPVLQNISRDWIQRGTTTEVVLTGEDLDRATAFSFTGGSGVTGAVVPVQPPSLVLESSSGRIESLPPKETKRVTVTLSVAADAPLGSRTVRLLGPGGVSNPVSFHVSPWPEAGEEGGKHSMEQSQAITFPVAISGVIGAPAETDFYRFSGRQGQVLIFDVNASRMGSALDSSLAILDAKGNPVAGNEDAHGLDSFLAFTVPADGDYFLTLRDFRYEGGGNFKYHLAAGVLPYVDYLFPFGARRGQTVDLALHGYNLDGVEKMLLAIGSDAPLGETEIRAHTPAGPSNPVAFEISDAAEMTESEPNNTPGQANRLSFPGIVNGRIAGDHDVDRFRFTAEADQKILCEVAAQQFGSPLDALLILSDAEGRVLQQNDDATGEDPRLEFDARKGTEYVLAIRDLTDREGERFGYRLEIKTPPRAMPSFTVRYTPDAVSLSRGGCTRVQCEVTRENGFKGPVRVGFDDLPPGVFGQPLVFAADSPPVGMLFLTARADAPKGNFPLHLKATGDVEGRKVERAGEPFRDKDSVADAFLTVLDEAPFSIEPLTLLAAMDQDDSTQVHVLVDRRHGFAGTIKLTAEGFSAGRDPIGKNLDVPEVTLKSEESQGALVVRAHQDSEVGTRWITVRGESTRDGAPVVEYSPPLPVTVRELPFVISSTLSKISVMAPPAGSSTASPASQTAFTVKLARRGGFDAEIPLVLEGLPEGVKAEVPKIAAKAGEALVALTATEHAPVGKEFKLTVSATATFHDRIYTRKTGEVTLSISAPTQLTGTDAAP